MRIGKIIITVTLILSLLTSCGLSSQAPLKNENNIPDAEVFGSVVASYKYDNKTSASANLRMRTDAYENCTLTVEGEGFLYWRDESHYVKDRVEYELTDLNTGGTRYEITKDGVIDDEYTHYSFNFQLKKLFDSPIDGYLTFTFKTKDKYTGKEYYAKCYQYYAVEDGEIKWSRTSIHDAHRHFDNDYVCFD